MKKLGGLILATIILFSGLFGQIKPASDMKVAQTFIQVSVFYKNLASAGEFSVYVVGNEKIASNLSGYIGQKVGSATLKSVENGSGLPSNKPDIIILSDKSMVGKVKSYCRDNQILSITNNPSLVEKGITLGIGLKNGKTSILINPEATNAEGVNWKSAIMKIAETI